VASAAVTPLKHPPPSLNVRPFIIESAYHTPGHIRCLVSAIKPRSVSSAAACEVFVIVLQYDAAQPAVSDTVMDGTSADSSQLPLFIRVSHVQLLQVTATIYTPDCTGPTTGIMLQQSKIQVSIASLLIRGSHPDSPACAQTPS
jgi:hypothetical protein